MTARLIYGFDPLCGWCYGFGPVLQAVRAELPDLAIDLRLGGLITGERIGPYADAASYIERASARMIAVTGVRLGDAFRRRILGDPTVISSSLPPSDALLQLRQRAPDRVLDMAEALQTAHFRDGMDLNDARTYVAVANVIGLDMAFHLRAPDVVAPAVAKEFQDARAFGLTSFPSLRLEVGGRDLDIEVSYDPKMIVAQIRSILADVWLDDFCGS